MKHFEDADSIVMTKWKNKKFNHRLTVNFKI